MQPSFAGTTERRASEVGNDSVRRERDVQEKVNGLTPSGLETANQIASNPLDTLTRELLAALDRVAADSLAGGIIASPGLAHTPAQAIEVQRVLRAMFAPRR